MSEVSSQQTTSGPRVSPQVATHNRTSPLREALVSVEAQTMPDREMLLVDDGSTPPSRIDDLPTALQSRIQLIRHQQPCRSAAARNTAVRAARGEVLAFFDDDMLAPDLLACALGVLDRHPGIEVGIHRRLVVRPQRRLDREGLHAHTS